jgi:hypothetical protein
MTRPDECSAAADTGSKNVPSAGALVSHVIAPVVESRLTLRTKYASDVSSGSSSTWLPWSCLATNASNSRNGGRA